MKKILSLITCASLLALSSMASAAETTVNPCNAKPMNPCMKMQNENTPMNPCMGMDDEEMKMSPCDLKKMEEQTPKK